MKCSDTNGCSSVPTHSTDIDQKRNNDISEDSASSKKTNLIQVENTPSACFIAGGLAILCLLGVMVYGRSLTESGFDWTDGAVHAMDGVLIHDFLAAGPKEWFYPMEFAQRQYARYPALGIGLHYPPAFAVVEAGVFAVLGVSSISARITVLGFSLITLVMTFLLLSRKCSIAASLIGASSLLCMPLIVTWSRQAMLEMPTLAALSLSVLLFFQYLDKPTGKRLFFFTLAAVAVPFFKQQAIFLLPILFFWSLAGRKRYNIPTRHLITASAVIFIIVGGFFTATLLTRGHVIDLISKGRPLRTWFGWDSWRIVLHGIVSGAGWGIVILAIAGLVTGCFQRTRVWWLGLFWLIMGILFNVLVQHKEERFLFYCLLPLALMIGLLAEEILTRIQRRAIISAVTTVFLLAFAALGFSQPRPIMRDYLPCVAAYRNSMQGEIILYAGAREPEFILAARQILGPEGTLILRGSKLFYSCASDPRYEYEQYVHSIEEVDFIIEQYAPHVIFVEDKIPFNLESEQLVRQYLKQTKNYVLDRSMETIYRPGVAPAQVHIYIRTAKANRTAQSINLPIPIIKNRIKMDLKTLGFE